MSWQPAGEIVIERLAGPAATAQDLADCLALTSALLVILAAQTTRADALLVDAAVWDIDAARVHLADQHGTHYAGGATPREVDRLAAPEALALCRRLLSAAVNGMVDADDVAARKAVSSADRYLGQVVG